MVLDQDELIYQSPLQRGYNSLNLDDKKTIGIASYEKQENGEYLFSTTCEVTKMEENYLCKSSGNYLNEIALKNKKALTITDTNTNDLQ